MNFHYFHNTTFAPLPNALNPDDDAAVVAAVLEIHEREAEFDDYLAFWGSAAEPFLASEPRPSLTSVFAPHIRLYRDEDLVATYTMTLGHIGRQFTGPLEMMPAHEVSALAATALRTTPMSTPTAGQRGLMLHLPDAVAGQLTARVVFSADEVAAHALHRELTAP